MLDEDRLWGLSAEEIDDVIKHHGKNVDGDITHAVEMAEGFSDFMKEKNHPYFNVVAKANGFVHGMEAGYWDKFKEIVSEMVRTFTETIGNITTFFKGDGRRQIDDAKEKSTKVIESINEIDPRTPVPENSKLRSVERYFKEPSLKDIDEEDVADFKSAIETMNKATELLKNVNTVGDLHNVYLQIQKASLTTATTLTDKITKRSADATKVTGELKSLKTPKNEDKKEVKDAMRQESEETINAVKHKVKSLQKLASLRNRFLAPTMVIIGSLSTVQSFQNKTFKG